jgi:flagellar biosynthesis/type III secretory pathway M-ring protein FliF/YscJ
MNLNPKIKTSALALLAVILALVIYYFFSDDILARYRRAGAPQAKQAPPGFIGPSGPPPEY